MKQAEDWRGWGIIESLKLKLAQVYMSGVIKRCTAGVVNGSSSATLSEQVSRAANVISGKREEMKAFKMSKASQGACMEHQNHLPHIYLAKDPLDLFHI